MSGSSGGYSGGGSAAQHLSTLRAFSLSPPLFLSAALCLCGVLMQTHFCRLLRPGGRIDVLGAYAAARQEGRALIKALRCRHHFPVFPYWPGASPAAAGRPPRLAVAMSVFLCVASLSMRRAPLCSLEAGVIVAASAENTNQDGFMLDIGSLRLNAGACYFTDEQLARCGGRVRRLSCCLLRDGRVSARLRTAAGDGPEDLLHR